MAPQQHGRSFGVCDGKFSNDAHAPCDPLDRIVNPRVTPHHKILKLEPHFGGYGVSKILLVSEMIEKTALRNARLCDQIVNRNGINRSIDQKVKTRSD